MKRIFSIVTTSAFTIMLATGCTSSLDMPAQVDKHDKATNKSAIYVGHAKTQDIMKAIKNGAQNDGWNVTEYKSNSVIVEKIVDDKAMSTTLVYQNGHISGNKDYASMDALLDLRKSIVTELKADSSDH